MRVAVLAVTLGAAAAISWQKWEQEFEAVAPGSVDSELGGDCAVVSVALPPATELAQLDESTEIYVGDDLILCIPRQQTSCHLVQQKRTTRVPAGITALSSLQEGQWELLCDVVNITFFVFPGERVLDFEADENYVHVPVPPPPPPPPTAAYSDRERDGAALMLAALRQRSYGDRSHRDPASAQYTAPTPAQRIYTDKALDDLTRDGVAVLSSVFTADEIDWMRQVVLNLTATVYPTADLAKEQRWFRTFPNICDAVPIAPSLQAEIDEMSGMLVAATKMMETVKAHFAPGRPQWLGVSEVHVGNGGPHWHIDTHTSCLGKTSVPAELQNYWHVAGFHSKDVREWWGPSPTEEQAEYRRIALSHGGWSVRCAEHDVLVVGSLLVRDQKKCLEACRHQDCQMVLAPGPATVDAQNNAPQA